MILAYPTAFEADTRPCSEFRSLFFRFYKRGDSRAHEGDGGTDQTTNSRVTRENYKKKNSRALASPLNLGIIHCPSVSSPTNAPCVLSSPNDVILARGATSLQKCRAHGGRFLRLRPRGERHYKITDYEGHCGCYPDSGANTGN